MSDGIASVGRWQRVVVAVHGLVVGRLMLPTPSADGIAAAAGRQIGGVGQVIARTLAEREVADE